MVKVPIEYNGNAKRLCKTNLEVSVRSSKRGRSSVICWGLKWNSLGSEEGEERCKRNKQYEWLDVWKCECSHPEDCVRGNRECLESAGRR